MQTTFPLFLHTRSRQNLGLISLSLSYFMVLLDSTVLNVALPAIEVQLNGSLESLQWILNSYTLVFASFLLSGGALGDRYGAQRIFRLGLAIFTLSSLLCSLAFNINILIIARLIQGIGAALMVPASLSLIAHLFTEPQQQAKAISIWAGIASLAVACGPLLGGFLVDFFGWRSVFIINIPCGLIALLITYASIPVIPPQKRRSLDLPGQVFAIVACSALTYALIEWGHMDAIVIIISFVIAGLAGAAFLVIEAYGKQPMLPLQLFRSRRFSVTTIIGLIFQFTFYSLIFIFSLFFQQEYHYQAIQTGLAFAPLTIVGSISILFATKWIMRFLRPQASLAIGMLIGATGMLIILMGTQTNFLFIAIGEALVGIMGAFVVAPMTSVILASVAKEHSGIASASLNMARQMGGVLGVAILGTVIGSQSLFTGTQMTLLIMAGALVIGFILILSTGRQKEISAH